MQKKFNQNSIRVLRQALNLTQAEFALRIGKNYTKQLVSQWENGEQVPSVRSLLSVVNSLNVPFEIFFEQVADYSNNKEASDG